MKLVAPLVIKDLTLTPATPPSGFYSTYILNGLVKKMGSNGIQRNIEASNVVMIQALSDFPTPVAGVITLVDNITYQINGSVNIGTNQIKRGVSNKIFGLDKSNDKLIYTGTSAMFIDTANMDISITFVTIANVTAGSTAFSWTGTTNNTQITDCIFGSCKSLGSISGGNLVIFNNNYITLCSAGLTFTGTINEVIVADNVWDDNSSTITCISVPSGTYNNFKISRNMFDMASGQTALNLSNSAITNGAGVIEICDFTGVGTYVVEANFASPVWQFRNNRGIINTFIFQPRFSERAIFGARATNGTFTTLGMSMTLNANSNAQSSDNTTTYTNLVSPALLGGIATLASTIYTELRPDYSPMMTFVIRTDSVLTTCRYWIGFVSSAMSNADDQSGAYVAFRFSSVAGDTGWRAIVDTGSANTISANIGTVTASTQYKLDIQIDFANSKCYFRVNGGAWTVVSAVPPSGTTLGINCGVSSTAVVTARNIAISRLDGNHN